MEIILLQKSNGLPDGYRITDMNGNDTISFSENEHFKVIFPSKTIRSSINYTISVRAGCKTYPVFYGQAPSGDLQNYAITFDPMADEIGTGAFNIDPYKSSIKVIKEDSETKARIPNVIFNFRYADGENIGNYTTDKNGEITVNNLRPGTVIVKEIQSNEDYILDSEEREIILDYNDSQIKTIENEKKCGNLQIYKVDKDNNKIGLGNVEFDLYSKEFGKVVGTYHTNQDGMIEIKNLRVGEYSLIEKKTNKWYNLADDISLKVEWNKTNTVTVENELKKGQIKVIKVDKENNSIKLEGVKFDVLDENGNVLETIVTNKDGQAYTSKYAIRDFSKLIIREKETLQNYELLEEPKTIALKENEITSIQFENEKIKGYVEITKVDSKTQEALEGAIFGIYDQNNTEVARLTTDENGKAISELLPMGSYYLKELDTGSVYYLLNEKTYEFEIVKNHETVPLTIENDGVNIEVTVDKEGTSEIEPGDEVCYTFSNIGNNSNIYLDNFKWFDYIPTDYVSLEKMTTGTWNQELSYDVYYKTNKSDDYILFKENLSSNENYDLDFSTLELEEDEYISETCFDFGKVDVGFKESTCPTMECKSFDTLQDSEKFTNETKTVGTYYGITAEADSKWTTIVHVPENPEPILPKTGR